MSFTSALPRIQGFCFKDRLKNEFGEELVAAVRSVCVEGRCGSDHLFEVPQPDHVSDCRRAGQGDWLYRADAGERRKSRAESHELAGNAAVCQISAFMFNLDKAKDPIRKLDYAIIVEGQMDCISVYSAGFKNVIASSGTAFSEAQVRLLGRSGQQLVENFGSRYGWGNGDDRSLGMLLEEDFQIKILRLEAGSIRIC